MLATNCHYAPIHCRLYDAGRFGWYFGLVVTRVPDNVSPISKERANSHGINGLDSAQRGRGVLSGFSRYNGDRKAGGGEGRKGSRRVLHCSFRRELDSTDYEVDNQESGGRS